MSLFSAAANIYGANKSADAMADAIEQATALQERQMRLAKQQFTPYAQAGTEALGLSVTECESGEASRAGGSGKFSERPFLREASQRSPMQTRASFPGPEK